MKTVQHKLGRAGVDNVDELLRRVDGGTLNAELGAAGEKLFAPETLEIMRITGLAAANLEAERGMRGVRHSLGRRGRGEESLLFGAAARDEVGAAREEYEALQRDICHGLDLLGLASAQARRRQVDMAADLVDVQAGVDRLAERMRAERQRRQPSSSASAATPKAQRPAADTTRPPAAGSARPSVSRSAQSASSSRPPAARARPPRSPSPRREETPRCSRAEQGGFTFGRESGDPDTGPPPQPRTHAGAPPPGSASPRLGFAKPPPSGSTPSSASEAAKTEEAAAKEAARAELLSARGGDEAERRAVVKRLMFQWHPDRNPNSVQISTAVFQYIQQEKTALLGLV